MANQKKLKISQNLKCIIKGKVIFIHLFHVNIINGCLLRCPTIVKLLLKHKKIKRKNYGIRENTSESSVHIMSSWIERDNYYR